MAVIDLGFGNGPDVAVDKDFVRAYEEHSAVVLGLAWRLLRDRQQAEDVTQEVFVRLWQRPERYVPERGSMRSFLMADCHGRAIDRLRSERSRSSRESRQAHAAQVPISIVEGADAVAGLVWEREVGGVLHRRLAALPLREAEPIALAYFGGRTYADVARILGEAEGTVKSRIRSGLRRLRDALVDSGEVADDDDILLATAI